MGDPENSKSISRATITGPNMYALLIKEFDRLKSPGCTRACRVPLPFWGPAPGNQDDVYWYMQTPAPCPQGCSHLLAQLWAKLTTESKIEAPEQEKAVWKHGMRTPVSQG
jgi:hypothetical protein